MEAQTHLLAGIVIQLIIFSYIVSPFNYILTVIFGILSHFLIDSFAKITYHTPKPHWDDKIWVVWHITVIILSIIIGVWFFIPFWVGMLSANLIDIIDWGIIRIIRNYRVKENNTISKKTWFVHNYIDKLREKLLSWLPDLNQNKNAILIEVGVDIVLITIILILK